MRAPLDGKPIVKANKDGAHSSRKSLSESLRTNDARRALRQLARYVAAHFRVALVLEPCQLRRCIRSRAADEPALRRRPARPKILERASARPKPGDGADHFLDRRRQHRSFIFGLM